MSAVTRTRDLETEAARTAPAQDRERFRPVALPALAAAMYVSATAALAVRNKLSARRPARIVHEDEPLP